MAQIVYYSVTGQTRQFVSKLSQHQKFAIQADNPFTQIDQPYILVVPTYQRELIEPVDDFLQTGDNQAYCQGIFAGGNRNFANLFCFTGKDLSQEYQIPVLHCFEFQGSDLDVQRLEEELAKLWNKNNCVKDQRLPISSSTT